MIIQWHLTERCNLRCRHCYQDAFGTKDLEFGEMIRILDEIENFADTFPSKRIGCERFHLNITGGEPFLYADFFRLLEEVVCRRRFSFGILSNGMKIREGESRQLKRLGVRFVQVSIEGKEGTHERIRGRGSYSAAVEGMERLIHSGVPVIISFTAHRGNWRELESVVQLGEELGVRYVWSDRLIPHGGAEEMMDQVMSPEEARDFFSLMHSIRSRKRRNTKVRMHRALQFLFGGGTPYRCTAGDSLVTILPDGTVTPCRRMPVPVGNLLQEPLRKIYEEHPLMRSLRNPPAVAAGCEECFHAWSCGGGLRCLSFAVKGRMFDCDPGCWLSQEERRRNQRSEVDVVMPSPLF